LVKKNIKPTKPDNKEVVVTMGHVLDLKTNVLPFHFPLIIFAPRVFGLRGKCGCGREREG
jgi:hypothetical protein